MNRRIGHTVIGCAALVSTTLLAGLCGAAPNLLVNGDFEILPDGIAPSDSVVTVFSGGSTALPGWTVTGDSIDLVRNNYWQNASGESSVDLDGFFATGGINQSFATEIGRTYRLTFAHAGNPDFSDEPLKTLQVTIATASAQYTFDVTEKTSDNMGWMNESLEFVADSTLSTLQFTSLDLGTHGRGPMVDNVAVSVVPEPAGLSFAALGLLAVARYRGRNVR